MCGIAAALNIIYENGANVCTGFLTSLDNRLLRTAPTLNAAVKAAQGKTQGVNQKYNHPYNVVSAALLSKIKDYDFEIKRGEAHFIRKYGKNRVKLFGNGFLISENAAKRYREVVERIEEARKQELAEEEKEIVARLSQNSKTERRESGKEFFFFFGADENG